MHLCDDGEKSLVHPLRQNAANWMSSIPKCYIRESSLDASNRIYRFTTEDIFFGQRRKFWPSIISRTLRLHPIHRFDNLYDKSVYHNWWWVLSWVLLFGDRVQNLPKKFKKVLPINDVQQLLMYRQNGVYNAWRIYNGHSSTLRYSWQEDAHVMNNVTCLTNFNIESHSFEFLTDIFNVLNMMIFLY